MFTQDVIDTLRNSDECEAILRDVARSMRVLTAAFVAAEKKASAKPVYTPCGLEEAVKRLPWGKNGPLPYVATDWGEDRARWYRLIVERLNNPYCKPEIVAQLKQALEEVGWDRKVPPYGNDPKVSLAEAVEALPWVWDARGWQLRVMPNERYFIFARYETGKVDAIKHWLKGPHAKAVKKLLLDHNWNGEGA